MPWQVYVVAIVAVFVILVWVLVFLKIYGNDTLPSPEVATSPDPPGGDPIQATTGATSPEVTVPAVDPAKWGACLVVAKWAWDHETQTYVEPEDPRGDVVAQEDCHGNEKIGIRR
jgi:hypothetical protein